MIEWASGALGVASALLRHFLDGPERKLRKEKLELEIRQLSKEASPGLNDESFQEFRRAVLAEIEVLSDRLPDVQFGGLLGPSLSRKSDNAADAIKRLSAAVEGRRVEISANCKPGRQHEEEAHNSPGPNNQDDADPHSNKEGIEWTAPTESPGGEAGDAASRVRSLSQRIEHRRSQDYE